MMCLSRSGRLAGRRRLPAVLLPRATALALFALSLLAAPLRAHDPYEAWSTAIVREDHLELTVTMADVTAFRLIERDRRTPLTRDKFPDHQPRLEEAAKKLFVLTAAKDVMKPSRTTVSLSDENDITFKVVYPRPPAGRLHLHAVFLEHLGDGYGTILEVADNAGNHLGWDQLSITHPSLEVTVLAKTPAKKP